MTFYWHAHNINKGQTGFPECEDIDECADFSCSSLGLTCTNLDPYYYCCGEDDVCACPIGHSIDTDNTCVPIECENGFFIFSENNVTICRDFDECASGTHACGLDSVCRNCNTLQGNCADDIDGTSVTGYTCNDCDEGFEDDGNASCVDIDECDAGTPCVSGVCVNTEGSYTCDCGTGYISQECQLTAQGIHFHEICNALTCVVFNQCDNEPCSTGETCTNLHPNFSCCDDQSVCQCPIGYKHDTSNIMGSGSDACVALDCVSGFERPSNGTICIDIDECATGTDTCEGDVCINCATTECGGFSCRQCDNGFEVDGNGNCVDVNECNSTPCGSGTCVNTEGSYTCDCDSGYISTQTTCVTNGKGVNNFHPHQECTEGPTCAEVNECDSIPCDYTCTDGDNSFRCCNDATQECACPSGYVLNGAYPGDCLPIVCNTGFELNGDVDKCVDRNECEADNYDCDDAFCINSVDGVRCAACPEGYELDDEGLCTDIDECAQDLDQCGNHALDYSGKEACENFPGSYTCNCDTGYEFNAKQCQIVYMADIYPHELCTYVPTCHDIDECKPGAGQCRFDYVCNNIEPGFQCCNVFGTRCECPSGYALINPGNVPKPCQLIICDTGYVMDKNGEYCVDVNECTEDCPGRMHDCDAELHCHNTVGAYTCEQCSVGYEADLFGVCHDIDECERFDPQCGWGSCVNTVGSFSCDCDIGYEVSEYRCNIIDFFDHHPHQICEDNHICVDTDECAIGTDGCRADYECTNSEPGFYCCNQDQSDCDCPPRYAIENEPADTLPRKCLQIQCYTGYELNEDQDFCIDLDECNPESPCDEGKICYNRFGPTYRCLDCPLGFSLDDSGNCIDENECEVDDDIDCGAGSCRNTIGSYTCDCDIGFERVTERCSIVDFGDQHPHKKCNYDHYCVDIDECALGISNCQDTYQCTNVPGGHRCCAHYLYGHSNHCNCGAGSAIWNANPEPQNVYEQHLKTICIAITCDTGFQLNEQDTMCVDVNECTTPYAHFKHECATSPDGEKCVNTDGSYYCQNCELGFKIDEDTGDCVDINECEEGGILHPVDCKQGVCFNTYGSYTCQCYADYGLNKIDGPGPSDLRCSVTNRDNQHPHQTCVSGDECIDIDECEIGVDDCRFDLHCQNAEAGFYCCNYNFFHLNYAHFCDCPSNYVMENSAIQIAKCRAIVCDLGYKLDGTHFYCEDIDECETGTDNCFPSEACVNNEGSFMCESCPRGFELVTTVIEGSTEEDNTTIDSCEDINECEVDSTTPCGPGSCVNTVGTYSCDCDRGYQISNERCNLVDHQNIYPHETCEDNSICVNTDECLIGTDLCPTDYHCHDRTPFFICCSKVHTSNYHCTCPPKFTMLNNESACLYLICDPGYELSEEETFCVDIDECSTETHTCSGDTFCHNNHGAYTCETCEIGYEPFVPEGSGEEDDPETGSCVDIDECTVDPDICTHGTCINSVGSYSCDCESGYVITTPRCELIDFNGEHEHEICEYNPTCLDLDECADGSDLCRTDYYCGNRDPFFHCCNIHNQYCECPSGYVLRNSGGLPRQCLLIVCKIGFELDITGTICADIDECGIDTDDCSQDTVCVNNEGSFTCDECAFGYEMSVEPSGDGSGEGSGEGSGSGNEPFVPECTDIDECANDDNLCRNGFCTNTVGGYYCTCDSGYDNSLRRCLEVDHDGPHGIEYPHEECELYETCINQDECADGTDNCPVDRHCYDREPFFQCCDYYGSNCNCPSAYVLANSDGQFGSNYGSHYRCIIIVCHEGYELNGEGTICIDKNECELNTHTCITETESCQNNEGSFTCNDCSLGYALDENDSCVDIDECSLETTLSCIQGSCVNTVGSYTCDCLPGFEIQNQRCTNSDLSGPYGDEYPHEACTYHPTCVNVNECALGTDRCAADLICTDLEPWFQCCYLHTHNYWNHYWVCTCPSEYVIYNDGGLPKGCTPILCQAGYVLDLTGYHCEDENECETGNHDCTEDQYCINLEGHEENFYKCEPCNLGYHEVTTQEEASSEGSGEASGEPELVDVTSCEDVNECVTESICGSGSCINTAGSYYCTCPEGYINGSPDRCSVSDRGEYPHQTCDNSPMCSDIDECGLGTDNCRRDLQCHNETPWFRCCDNNQYHCYCPYGTIKLQHSNKCIPLVCETGYDFAEPDGYHCRDVDECATGLHNCYEDEYCLNNEGGFSCEVCYLGFESYTYEEEGSGGETEIISACRDVNECDSGIHTCDAYGPCVNTEGSFTCDCVVGMTLREDYVYQNWISNQYPHETRESHPICVDQDECVLGLDNCPLHKECQNASPFFKCCTYSYYHGWQCECPPKYIPFNNDGQHFRCQYIYCDVGYELDPQNEQLCINIDECATGLHNCAEDEFCFNNEGAFECRACDAGFEYHEYEVEGSVEGSADTIQECRDINECEVEPTVACGPGTCLNTDGSYTCVCDSGYEVEDISRCWENDIKVLYYIDFVYSTQCTTVSISNNEVKNLLTFHSLSG